MITYADVYIWGMHAGTVAWDENRQTCSFEYTRSFANQNFLNFNKNYFFILFLKSFTQSQNHYFLFTTQNKKFHHLNKQ